MSRRDRVRALSAGLDTWPRKRPHSITIQGTPDGVFAVSLVDGRRLLKLPVEMGDVEYARIGRDFKKLAEQVKWVMGP